MTTSELRATATVVDMTFKDLTVDGLRAPLHAAWMIDLGYDLSVHAAEVAQASHGIQRQLTLWGGAAVTLAAS